jgi:periplasmic divalent cation tolerance protein
MTDKCILLTTTDSKEHAKQIARALVEARLAACVNISGPIESVYRWKENVENAREWLLIVKTTTAAFERVRDAIRELHSYELPECVLVPINDGSTEYLNWISDSVT